MADTEVQENAPETQPEIELNVDPQTHLLVTVQDFDRKIADAKAAVANLESQKASYIYETNVKLLINQAKQQEEQAKAEADPGTPEG